MAHKFTDEEKEVSERNSNYFGFGVHRVLFAGAIADVTEAGKEFIEVAFCDPDNSEIEDTARVWFVGGASNISFNTLRQIYVHNAPEDKKVDAGLSFDKVADSAELVDLMNDKLQGGELWFTKFYDAKGATYVSTRDGQTYKSTNKNIYGYEPKDRPDLMPAPKGSVEDVIPGAEPASKDAAANIPKSW